MPALQDATLVEQALQMVLARLLFPGASYRTFAYTQVKGDGDTL